MNPQWDVIGHEGFKFMGKMNASISHEIKNVLAIINENAGLLEDFTLMAEQGKPMDPERLKTVAGKIQSQVRRADNIVKNMNTFAHSVDETTGDVELGGLVSFMAALSERLATMKGLTFSVALPADPLVITANPFFLETIIWFCLDFAMETAGSGKRLHLSAHPQGRWAEVMISGFENQRSALSHDMFPGARENAVLQAIGGRVALDDRQGEIVLSLPRAPETP